MGADSIHRYQFPNLRDTNDEGNALKGCLVIYDGQQNDTRMNLHIVTGRPHCSPRQTQRWLMR
jgi:hypothetical protein